MRINKIQLSNFRNFKNKSFRFSPKTTIIVGPNASGKTNILESIFLLSTGKSFRARVEEEMINYGEEIARVKGVIIEKIEGKKSGNNLEVVLTRGEITVGMSPKKKERVARKRLLINGVGKRLIDFAGKYRVVLFGPHHLEIVTESPSIRRDFLDTVLVQTDREYRRASLSYEKGLRQRNRLLFRIREEGLSRSQLLFWNKLLIRNGDYIASSRQNFIEFANDQDGLDDQKFSLDYDKSAISQARLEQYREEEIAAATTLVGPHRDDVVFKVASNKKQAARARDLARFGSRGEQRMATLWLKLVELSYIKQETGEKPTLLLDDIFSELDHKHRDIVMKEVEGQQTIITTADPHFVEKFAKVERIDLKI
jgi:DNA replication and repair protein RecF